MTNPDLPVTEDELHAYVDGELAADRQDAVAAWLLAHPEDAERIAIWRAQAEAMRARYSHIADEPVPGRFHIDRLLRGGPLGRRVAAIAVAATVAAFLVGGVAGWMARGASAAPGGLDLFTSDALSAHRLYVVEVRHPVEVAASERAHMVQWLSKRLGYNQHVPNLETIGLKLIGGRLLPGPTGAAALYMYEGPTGERFTIYSARTRARAAQTALRYKQGDRIAAYYWVDNQAAFVVSGPADRDRLKTVAEAVYEQVDQATRS
jgi:anti-sigma factor RsiW